MQYTIEHQEQNTKSSGIKIATVSADTVHCKSQLYSKIQAVNLSMDTAVDLDRAVQLIRNSNHSKIRFESYADKTNRTR